MTNHLYIHIPFCFEICSYCDFYRIKTNDFKIMEKYVDKIISVLNSDINLYETIYIGGGTPNFLPNDLLDKLLFHLQLKLKNNYEFTIELNPEFVNANQIKILEKNKINRLSVGIQTSNDNILKLLRRTHTFKTAIKAIKLLKIKFENISCDFIYNLPFLNETDLKNTFNFISNYKINHISFYSLELKPNALLSKQNYKLNIDKEANQLDYIKKAFKKLNYDRYEISNWSRQKKYQSKHNLAYWNLADWKAIGISSYGFEKQIYYHTKGTLLNWKIEKNKWDVNEFATNIFIMGLRKKTGINLNIKRNLDAFNLIKDKLDFNWLTIKNNIIKAKKIDLLNEILIKLI